MGRVKFLFSKSNIRNFRTNILLNLITCFCRDEKTFRRSNALWIGCAIIIRPPKNSSKPGDKPLLIQAHLVCIYAALSKFKSIVGNANNESCCNYCPPTGKCRIDYTKNKLPYTNLCSRKFVIIIID